MPSSPLYKGEIVIDDDFPDSKIEEISRNMPKGLNKGFGANYGNRGLTALPKKWLIPRNEWQPRIEEIHARKMLLSDRIRKAGVKMKNQASLNYCWVFAVVHSYEINRLSANMPYKSYSPVSVGGPIKGWANVGGWGVEAIQRMGQEGVNETADWPDTALDKRYYTAANREKALENRVTEWFECEPRNIDEHISLLLHLRSAAAGRSWWAHEITDVDAVWVNGAIGVRYRNQWLGFGDDGFAILQGNRMLADDLVSPQVSMAV